MFWLKRSKPLPEYFSGISCSFPSVRMLLRLSKALLFFLVINSVQNPSLADGFVFPADFPKELRQQHQQAFTKTEILDAWHTSCLYFLEKADFANTISAGNELKEYAIMFRQPKYEAGAYEVQGMAYEYLGQLAKAVEYHLKSLQIRERLGRKKPIALSLSHMGDVYSQLKSYAKAESYFRRSWELFKLEGNESEAAEVEYNLGYMYELQGNYQAALKIFRKSIYGFKKTNDSINLANTYYAVGMVFIQLKELDSALFYHMKALNIRKSNVSEMKLADSYAALCNVYLEKKEIETARFYGEEAYRISSNNGILEAMEVDLGNLSDLEVASGNFKRAFSLLTSRYRLRDSLNNQNAQEEIARQNMTFEIQKQQYQDSLKEAEEIRKTELKRRLDEKEQFRKSTLQYTGIFLFIMALLAAIFLIRRIQLPVIWLEGGIFFTALLLFEFLLLILDPLVELYSGGAPVYKFAMNLVLGLIVFYAHSFFENKMKTKLLLSGRHEAESYDLRGEASDAEPHVHVQNPESE